MKKNPISKYARQLSSGKRPATRQGFAGYDNPRENVDPHVRTLAINTKEIFCNYVRVLDNPDNTQLQITNTSEQFAINIDSYRTDDTFVILNSRMTALHSSFKVRGVATDPQQGAMIGAFQEYASSTGQCFFAGQWGLGHGIQVSMTNTSNTNKGMRIDNSAGVTTDFVQFNSSAGERWSIDKDGIPATQGSPGVSGSFTTTDGKTVTVTNGIITSIV